jgi:cobaltochelatase CobS
VSYQTIAMEAEPSLGLGKGPKPFAADVLASQAKLEEIARTVVRTETDLLSSAMVRRLDETIARLQLTMMSEIAKVERPLPQVLAVKVNDGELRRLSKPAPKYLGRMIELARTGKGILLVGPAGCGKSTAAELMAEALGLRFGAISCTAGMSETWLMGRQLANGYLLAPFVDVYENGGVFLLDEIDAADSNILITLNNALANGYFDNPMTGKRIMKHAQFICVAGANTHGKGSDGVYTARNRLDGATLDRFWTIKVDYDRALESALCPDKTLRDAFWNARKQLSKLQSDEFLSTRKLKEAYELKTACGWSYADIFESLCASWPSELFTACGLDKIEDAKPEQAVTAPESPPDAEMAAELEKARAENASLKTGRKAFQKRGE